MLAPEWQGPAVELEALSTFNGHLPDYHERNAVVYIDVTGAALCARCATTLRGSGAEAVGACVKNGPVNCAECGHEIPR